MQELGVQLDHCRIRGHPRGRQSSLDGLAAGAAILEGGEEVFVGSALGEQLLALQFESRHLGLLPSRGLTPPVGSSTPLKRRQCGLRIGHH